MFDGSRQKMMDMHSKRATTVQLNA